MQDVMRTSKYYHQNTREAFFDGFYELQRSKRHLNTQYDIYHYFLPSKISPTLKYLKKYFSILDRDKSVDQLQGDHKFRQTHFEFVETCINTLWDIQSRIISNKPIVAAAKFEPCPWAVFGLNTEKHLCRNHFSNLMEVFKYYDYIMWGKGCNIMRVSRVKYKPDNLLHLSRFYRKSCNYILATAIMLTCDIIKHCSPECNEFKYLFTNDKLENGTYLNWQLARNSLSPPLKDDVNEIIAKSRYYASYKKYQGYNSASNYRQSKFKSSPSYFEVKLQDSPYNQELTEGESFEMFSKSTVNEEKKPFVYKTPTKYDDFDLPYEQPILSDIQNNEIDEMDEQFRNIIDSENAFWEN